MMRYDSYKSSGIEWLGDVPSHWDILRIGQVFKERKEKVSDKDFAPLSVTKNGIVPQLDNAAKSNAGDDRKKVLKGDFVINSRSDRKGSSGVSPLDGSVSLISIVLEPKELYGKYIHSLLRSYDFTEEFYKNGQGIVADLWSTKYSLMKSIYIPIPPKDEQKEIADFLDKKLDSINSYILKQKELIELLKEKKSSLINGAVTRGLDSSVEYKQSSIEWLGEIPKHWEVKKLKYISKIYNGATPSSSNSSFWNGDVIWVTPEDISKNLILKDSVRKITKEGYKNCGTTIVPKDSLILTTRAPIGNISISEQELCTNQGCKSVVINIGEFKFYYYVLLSNNKILNALGSGTTFMELSTSSLKNFIIPTTSIDEQKQIVNYIEKESKKIDDVISNIEDELKLLDEYKQSIISSAVTGKIKVC